MALLNTFKVGSGITVGTSTTLGTTTIYGGNDSNDPNGLVVSGPFTVGANTKILDGQVRQKAGGSGSQKMRLVVYGDNGSNHPNPTPLGASDEVNVPATGGDRWVVFPFTSPPALTAGQKIWIGPWWGPNVSAYDFILAAGTVAPPPSQFYDPSVTYASASLPASTSWPGSGPQDYSIFLDMVAAPAATPQTVPVPSVYPPGYAPTIVDTFVVNDGHVVNGVAGSQFGTPTVFIPQTLPVNGVGSAQAFGVVTRITGGTTSSSSGVPSAQAFGTVTPKATVATTVAGLGSTQAFGVPTTAYVLHLAGLGSAQAFGTLTATASASPPQSIQVGGVPSAQRFGSPTIKTSIQSQAGGVPSAQAFGSVFLVYPQSVPVGALASAQAFGSTETGLAVFNVWIDDLDCIAAADTPICGGPICGEAICGGVDSLIEEIHPIVSFAPIVDEFLVDQRLVGAALIAPITVIRTIDLQPVGCE